MIKSIAVFGVALFCMYSLDASVLLPNEPQQLSPRALINLKNDGKGSLCDSCKDFFTFIKGIIGDVDDLTKDTLENALNLTCKYLEGSAPFVDQICEEFGPEFIDALYEYLTEVEKEIDPEHDCKLLLLCWGDKASQKSFFQRMIVKNKIRFD